MKKKMVFGIMCLLVAAISVTAVACKKQGGGGGEEGTEGLLYEYNEITDSYQVSAGEAENEKHIVVPGTHKDKPVTAIAYGGFSNCAAESIVLPASITSIGQSAFSGCVALTSVTLPENPTSIGSSAFSGCYNLQPSKNENGAKYLGSSQNPYLYLWEVTDKTITDFTIGEGTAFIDSNAFSYCNKLQTVNWNAVDCKVAGSVYFRLFDSQSLTTVNIGDNVKVIPQNVFAECAKLQPSKTTSNAKYLGNSENPYLYLWEVTDKSITNFTVNGKTKIIGSSAFSAFPGCDRLASITIPANVTSIGGSAFGGCTNLQTVTFAGDSKLESIGEMAFQQCSKLTEITIPSGVTSIGDYAFYICSNLAEITIPASVISIGGSAFSGCVALTSLTLPESVTSIGQSAFSGCSSLESISVASGNKTYSSQGGILYNYAKTIVVYSPAKMEGAVTIPESVTSIGGSAFSGCSGLTSITIPANVTSIDSSAFSGCDSLESISVAPGNKAYSSLGGILYNYGKTTIVQVPYGIKGAITIPESVTSIGDRAFSRCSKLTSITLPASVTYINNYAFSGCSSLENINVASGNKAYSSQYGILYNYDKTEIICVPGGKQSVTLPASVTSIGYDVFLDCSSLESINVAPGNKTYSSKDGILYNHDKTEFVYIPMAIKGAVTIPNGIITIDYNVFSGRSGLTSITIPASVTSIGERAFYDCAATINWGSAPKISYIGYYAFSGYKGTSITIPANVTSIDDSAFADCANLHTVNWNATNCAKAGTSYYPIFKGCTSLTTVNIGENVQTIPDYAFYNCTNLRTVTFAGDSELQSIGASAFYNCSNLTSITIPANVTSIGDYAFDDCTRLQAVDFKNPVGWKVSYNSDMSNAEDISASDLQDKAKAAQYLKNTYSYYYWKRT